MFQWFNATEAVAFGKHMAQEVARIVPVEASQLKGKKEQKRLDKFRRAIVHASDLGAPSNSRAAVSSDRLSCSLIP